MMQKDIIIEIEGGVITSISNIPPDITIKVIDYDCDGSEEPNKAYINEKPAITSI